MNFFVYVYFEHPVYASRLVASNRPITLPSRCAHKTRNIITIMGRSDWYDKHIDISFCVVKRETRFKGEDYVFKFHVIQILFKFIPTLDLDGSKAAVNCKFTANSIFFPLNLSIFYGRDKTLNGNRWSK